MSQSYYEDDDNEIEYYDDEPEPEPEPESNAIRNLRKQAKEAKAAQARVKELEAEMQNTRAIQQELALRRAGIDPETPLAQMFVKANPDLVDVDGIKSEWEKVAIVAPSHTEDAAALNRINAAQAGGTPSGGADPDFEGELDSIPMIVDGEWNPNYAQEVLKATAVQAAREGREFVTSAPGRISMDTKGAVTTPLQ